jgi:hypothetical protein
MDNQTGLAILSSVLHKLSYSNQILPLSQDDSNGIDVGVLHKLLMKGCYTKDHDDNGKAIQLIHNDDLKKKKESIISYSNSPSWSRAKPGKTWPRSRRNTGNN